jgi:ABC-type multidrug transport system permease subunit
LPASWAFTCLVLGQFVSSSANPMVALTVLPAFAAPMIMFSGVLYEKSTAPAWLGWLHRVSLVNYAFSALVTEQIHTLPQAMAQILQDFVDLNRNGTGANVLYMGVLILALQGLTYLALSWRVRHSRSAA